MMKMCLHRYTHDSQGAEYCQKCGKFRRWMPPKVSRTTMMGGHAFGAWGYLHNGVEWLYREQERIKANGGYYRKPGCYGEANG